MLISKTRYINSVWRFDPYGSLASTYPIKYSFNITFIPIVYTFTLQIHQQELNLLRGMARSWSRWWGTKHPRMGGSRFTDHWPWDLFQREQRFHGPDSLAFSDFSYKSIMALSELNSHDCHVWFLCLPLLKCSATGNSSALRCAKSYQWTLLLMRGWPTLPTYWRPHLLHIIKYITLEVLHMYQKERNSP